MRAPNLKNAEVNAYSASSSARPQTAPVSAAVASVAGAVVPRSEWALLTMVAWVAGVNRTVPASFAAGCWMTLSSRGASGE